MFTNGSVSLYHFDSKTEVWKRTLFPAAHIYLKTDSDIGTADFDKSNYCIIRVPYPCNTEIGIGDYICLKDAEVFDKANCLKVMSFCKNNSGSSPHLKIICA